MENTNQVIIISLLIFIAGLLIGYLFGTNTMPNYGFLSTDSMYEEMAEHMYEDDIINGDGELQHMMDEMLLIGRGKTGEAYEEAFLRGMVTQHFGAIAISKNLLKQTERPELVEFANDVIENQTAEVETMKGWLEVWFDNKN